MFNEKIEFELVEEKGKVKRLFIDLNIKTDTYTERFDLLEKETFSGARYNVNIECVPKKNNVFMQESTLEKEIQRFITKLLRKYKLKAKDVMVSGFRAGATVAMILGMKYNYHFISIAPHMYNDENIKNTKLIKHIFGLSSFADVSRIIKHGEYTIHGKLIHTHYDLYPYSYEEEILNQIKQDSRIQLISLEDFYFAYFIKESSVKILELCQEEYNNYCRSFSENLTLDCQRYNFFMGDPLNHRVREFEGEKVYHKVINNKNRCVKYRLRKIKNCTKLVVTFSGEVRYDHAKDIMPSYNFNQVFNDDFNVLAIRPTFSLTGGLTMIDRGDTYPVELVTSLIENQCKELGITKDNVILMGTSGGALASIFYAKKCGFKNILIFAPVMNLENICLNRPESLLNISNRLDEEEKKKQIKVWLDKLDEVIYNDYQLNGVAIYSSADPFIGSNIKSDFIEMQKNIKFIDIKDELPDNTSHQDIIRKAWFDIGYGMLKKRLSEME